MTTDIARLRELADELQKLGTAYSDATLMMARDRGERLGGEYAWLAPNETPHWKAVAAIDDLLTELAAARAQVAGMRTALEPFAGIGSWLFARALPDDTPVVELTGINGGRGALTRGHFKAAHTALADAKALSPTPAEKA